MAKTPKQLDAEIASVLAKPRGKRKPKKTAHEIRTERLKALQRRMADALGDDAWLDTDLYDLEKWLTGVDENELSDAAWLRAALGILLDNSVSPEHAGAPPPNVYAWNDIFIGTYRMIMDVGRRSHEEAIGDALTNANDTITLTRNERDLINTDPALYRQYR